MTILIYSALLLPFITFIYWMYQHPTSLWTGFWFLSLLVSIATLGIVLLEQLMEPLALLLGSGLALLIIGLSILGVYATIIGLFWNERLLLKHEKKTLGNFLPLITATFLLVLEACLLWADTHITNQTILKLFAFINLSFTYFALLFILYLVTAILYNHYPLKKRIDYIIVLGAGLNKDKVTPLLASRIEAGVQLYKKQVAQGYSPTLILSGGQGSDELIPEAEAMANYLIEKNITIPKVYLEKQSTNTRENLQYSQIIAQKKDGIRDFTDKKVVVASNNYHLLRAGKIAKQLGMSIRGIGSSTRLYYLPTAFIREYIGYLVMTKRMHLIVIGWFFILTIVPLLLDLLI